VADSVQERILDAMRLALAQGLDQAGVVRRADRPVEQDRQPWVNILDGANRTDDGVAFGVTDNRMAVRLELVAAKGVAVSADAAIDALQRQAKAILLANRTWGGLAIDTMIEAGEVERDRESSLPGGVYLLDATVWFWTKTQDPTAVGP